MGTTSSVVIRHSGQSLPWRTSSTRRSGNEPRQAFGISVLWIYTQRDQGTGEVNLICDTPWPLIQ